VFCERSSWRYVEHPSPLITMLLNNSTLNKNFTTLFSLRLNNPTMTNYVEADFHFYLSVGIKGLPLGYISDA